MTTTDATTITELQERYEAFINEQAAAAEFMRHAQRLYHEATEKTVAVVAELRRAQRAELGVD